MAPLTREQKQKFESDGLLVLENFLSPEEVSGLRAEILRLVREMDPAQHRGIFSTTEHNQANDKYFLDSGDDIRFFFENNSFSDKDGQLLFPKEECLNKIGHALHWWNSAFKKATFSEKVKQVASDLNLTDPAVVQGMYIFKQPRIGTRVTPHQDGTFLRNDPLKLVGFWFPIDDATLENGCLWYVPGSHKMPVTRHFVRSDKKDSKLLIFRGQDPTVTDDKWVAAPVNKGSLVLIHGQVLHKSEANTSLKPRHAYTFHMVETDKCSYSEENWLQPTESMPFPKLFDN